ncbi:MAG: T9SS type A sorting domain-containing protein [Myroides sp.]
MKKLILTILTLVPILTQAQVTLIPDQEFEKRLIFLGVDTDGLVNGQILTSDIHNTTTLNLSSGVPTLFPIFNLTGINDFINLEEFMAIEMQIPSGINLSTLTKLRKLTFASNNQNTISFSALLDLEELNVGNASSDVGPHNTMKSLDLSNNTKLKYISAFNLFELQQMNIRNNIANAVTIALGNETMYPQNICIEVDNHIAATNGLPPYDTWSILSSTNTNYYFSDKCVLSIEKFVNDNFKIYPNPATTYISIEQKETDGVTLQSVQILDSSGKWIKSIKDNFNQIDVSNLSKGMYLFVIQTDKGNKTEKVLVK